MGEFGIAPDSFLFVFSNHHAKRLFPNPHPHELRYSEMKRYYAEARKILIKNREFLYKLAAALVQKKTVIARDIKAIKATCKLVA